MISVVFFEGHLTHGFKELQNSITIRDEYLHPLKDLIPK